MGGMTIRNMSTIQKILDGIGKAAKFGKVTTLINLVEDMKKKVSGDEETVEAEKARKEGIPRKLHNIVQGENRLPANGIPNSSSDLLNPDGTHEFPHRHIWDWDKKPPRQPEQ